MQKMEIASAFALVLKKHRDAKGFSQELLAEKADLHPTHVSLIERKLRNPSLNVAKSLAESLGVTLTEMIAEAEQIQKHSEGKKHINSKMD
jgi:ribosome-binding protein aMBF1 (putative translation factor)